MKLKNIMLVVMGCSLFFTQDISATSLSACESEAIIDSTPDVVPGNGGQDYVSSVWFSIYSSDTQYPHSYSASIAIYDWNGKHVEDIEGDPLSPNQEPMEATGIVDGTYTYVINGNYKGTFNVNHNIKNEVLIDAANFTNCDTSYETSEVNQEYTNEDYDILDHIIETLDNIIENLNRIVNTLFN